ncbi:MAG TPA: hypothetical protein VK738_21370 [Terriglobales bacterium]|jgi:hypothetical protein|nr:hypothetical protein [Terriglobales bacterium]
MIFAVQGYLEDYFVSRGLSDPDRYAITLAKLYDQERSGRTVAEFLASMKRIRTAFYRRNTNINRDEFSLNILSLLDTKFKKRLIFLTKAVAERVESSGKRLTVLPRITIRKFLDEFKHTVEAEAVNSFWESRSKGRLKKHPEKHGQELLGVFAKAKLAGRGSLLREAVSGIGFVDVLVTFSSGLVHIVELKMLSGSGIPGPAQLESYMRNRARREGWLVFFDVRKLNQKQAIPAVISRASGTIRTIVVDVNPVPPNKLR